jgi:membrane-associated phospholipid phosphatase
MVLLIPALLSAALAVPAVMGDGPAEVEAGSGVAVSARVESLPAPLAAPDPDGPPDANVDTLSRKPSTPEHTGFRALLAGVKDDVVHLPSRQSLLIAGIGGGLALGVRPFDRNVNARILNQYAFINTVFAPAKYFGDTPEQMALSIGTWALGRVLDKPKLSHLGMDLLRAQAVTEIMVEPIKFATHRERPDGSNYQSFPSGHAAITFAAAAVIERHLGWKHSIWAYGIASYVAASRLHDNKHYLSDVVFGAAVGSIAGRTVTRHGPDTWTLGPTAVPGGVAIMVARAGF